MVWIKNTRLILFLYVACFGHCCGFSDTMAKDYKKEKRKQISKMQKDIKDLRTSPTNLVETENQNQVAVFGGYLL